MSDRPKNWAEHGLEWEFLDFCAPQLVVPTKEEIQELLAKYER